MRRNNKKTGEGRGGEKRVGGADNRNKKRMEKKGREREESGNKREMEGKYKI